MLVVLQPCPAAQTHMQFRQQTRQPDGPQAEVGHRLPRRARSAGPHMLQYRHQQPEITFIRLARRQHLLGNFGEEIQRAGRREIASAHRTANRSARTNRPPKARGYRAENTPDSHAKGAPAPIRKPLFGRRARLATPRSLPRSRVRKLTIRSPSGTARSAARSFAHASGQLMFS